MIRHIVLFNLKPELEPSDRDWILEQIQGLSRVTSVRDLALGRLLEPKEEWYKPRLSAEFRWALTIEFENEDGLYAYQTDPYHVGVAQEIRKRVSGIRVMDFVTLQP
jgi:hypothetical protein